MSVGEFAAAVRSAGAHRTTKTPHFDCFTMQSPFADGQDTGSERFAVDARFVNPDTNLYYFERRYDAILAQQSEILWQVFVGRLMSRLDGVRGSEKQTLFYSA
jgi:hypothetical protein